MISKLRKLQRFPGIPESIERALAQLETNVQSFASSVQLEALLRWDVTPVVVTTADSPMFLPLGWLALVDTTDGAVVLHLPKATNENRGKRVSWIQTGTGNTLTIEPAEGEIDGDSSLAIAADPGGSLGSGVAISCGADQGWRTMSSSTAPAAVGPSWQTLLDVDFTNEANQTLDSDTTYSIGGWTWTKKNSANDVTAMSLQNGVGVVCCPVAGLDHIYTGEAPKILISLSSIFDDSEDLVADTPIRAMMRGYCKTCATGASHVGVALEYDAAGYACAVGTRYYNSATTPYSGQAFLKHEASTVETVIDATQRLPTYECPAIWMPHGIAGMSLRYGRGLWNSGWPEIPWFAGWGPANELWQDASWPGVGIPRNWQLAVGAATQSQNAGYEWVIQNVRFDAYF
jgi:hypothetical protein